jgi:hypothetical protein
LSLFTFDAESLGSIIAHSCRRVLESHGMGLTHDDQVTAGDAAAEFLQHAQERARMIDSVSKDLDQIPVLPGRAHQPVDARKLGLEPPV